MFNRLLLFFCGILGLFTLKKKTKTKTKSDAFLKQECIPVGCVPPAHWPYLRISSYPMHTPLEQPRMPPQSNHACPPEQPCTPPRSNHACPPPPGATTHAPPGATMHAPQEQPCMRPPSNHACLSGATMHAPLEQPCTPPPRATTNSGKHKKIDVPMTFTFSVDDSLCALLLHDVKLFVTEWCVWWYCEWSFFFFNPANYFQFQVVAFLWLES